MLKKSAVNTAWKRSVIAVFFPKEVSRFQWPSPRKGRERPERPSVANSTGRKSLETANGSPKRFNPEPGFGHVGGFGQGGFGLLFVPTPLEPVTPVCTPS